MKINFRRALGFGVVALVVLALLVTPLAQATGFERPGAEGLVGRMVGLGLFGVATLLRVQTPVLLASGWLVRGRTAIPRVVWALLAGVLAMAPITALNVPGEALSSKISETLDAVWSQPLVFVTEWLPFVASGGVFGWYFFIPQRRSVGTAG